MSDQFTPTTEQIRDVALFGAIKASGGRLDTDEFRAQFDRWLAAHDAEKRAERETEREKSKIQITVSPVRCSACGGLLQ